MRLIDADKAKAELLRIARDIHDCCGFYDGLKAGYQRAADRLDTMPTVEERDKGYWIDIDLDMSICSVCKNPQEYETKYCPECGAKMDGDNAAESSDALYLKKELLKNIQDVLTYGK